MPVTHASGRQQRGFLLVEFMVVALLATLLVVWASTEWAERNRRLQAQSLVVWQENARLAVQAYLDKLGGDIAQASATQALQSKGFANWSRPSWGELAQAGFLSHGWRDVGPLGQQLAVQVLREGSCPHSPCSITALVHTQKPLTGADARTDDALIAQWLLASAGRGLVIWSQKPQVFSGAGMQLPVPPPVAGKSWPVGTVAMLAGPVLDPEPSDAGEEPSDPADPPVDHLEEFLRVGDSRDPDFQGDASVHGVIRSGRRLEASESLVLQQEYAAGSPCSDENAIARSLGQLGLLQCRQSRWNFVARPAGGAYMHNTRRGCMNQLGAPTANPLTGSCSCPSGYTPLQVAESGTLTGPEGLSAGFVCVPN